MLSAGQRVDDYEIVGILGDGGMGAVYEAMQLSLRRTVALKVIDTRLSSDEAFRERFRREGEIQAQLDHPNIVPVYEAGESSEGLFIAMRIIRGTTLKGMIDSGSLDDRSTVKLLAPIADALDAAHDDRLIHRDVKPQNILIDEENRPFLADFGLTKRATSAGLTRTGQFVGTFDYVSPEQVLGENATPASDIYSLAAVTFECLTGVPPFVRPNDASLLYAQVHEDPPDLRSLRPDLPKGAAKACRRGLAKSPADRYESASELTDALRRTLGGSAGKALAPRQRLNDRQGRRGARAKPAEDDGAKATTPEDLKPQVEMESTTTPQPTAEVTVAAERGGVNRAESELEGRVRTERPGAGATNLSDLRARRSKVLRGRQAVGLGVSAIAIVGVGVGVIGSEVMGTSQATGSTLAISEPATIRPPGEWQQVGGATAIKGLGSGLRNPQALKSSGPNPSTIALGTSPDGGNRLLIDPKFARSFPPKERVAEELSLPGGQALSYTVSSQVADGRRMAIVAIPTSNAVVNIVCTGRSLAFSDSALGVICKSAAASMSIAKPAVREKVTADPRYAADLNGFIAPLNRDVSRSSRSLDSATTSGTQATAAGGLERAYASASQAAGRVTPPQRALAAHKLMVRGLTSCRDAYRRLETAASAENAGAYASAQVSVTSCQRKLANATANLRSLGYRVRG